MQKIGNIRDLKRRAGGGGGIGSRIRSVSTTALDRAEQAAKAAIEDAIPLPERGSLDEELSPEEQDELMEGLNTVMGCLSSARGPNAARARALVQGLAGAVVRDDHGPSGYSGDDDGFDEFDVDSIGLTPRSGGLVRPDDGDWR